MCQNLKNYWANRSVLNLDWNVFVRSCPVVFHPSSSETDTCPQSSLLNACKNTKFFHNYLQIPIFLSSIISIDFETWDCSNFPLVALSSRSGSNWNLKILQGERPYAFGGQGKEKWIIISMESDSWGNLIWIKLRNIAPKKVPALCQAKVQLTFINFSLQIQQHGYSFYLKKTLRNVNLSGTIVGAVSYRRRCPPISRGCSFCTGWCICNGSEKIEKSECFCIVLRSVYAILFERWAVCSNCVRLIFITIECTRCDENWVRSKCLRWWNSVYKTKNHYTSNNTIGNILRI